MAGRQSDILHQAAPSPQSLANLKYTWKLDLISTSAWHTAGQTGTLALLHPEEAAKYTYLYTLLDHNINIGAVYIQKVNIAKTIAERLHRQGSVSPADQQRLLALTDELGGSAAEQLQMYTFVDASLKDWLAHNCSHAARYDSGTRTTEPPSNLIRVLNEPQLFDIGEIS